MPGRTDEITSPHDPRLADYFDLRHTAQRPVVIVEGATALEQVPGSGFAVRSVLCLRRHLTRVRAIIGEESLVLCASADIIRSTVGFNLHRGVVAALDRPDERDPSTLLRSSQSLAVLERLNDLENLGALFRNARAFGIDAVLLDPQTADPLNRRTVRVSIGHVLRVPFGRSRIWPPDLEGFTVLALTPRGETDIAALDVSGPVAIVLGAEGTGLSESVLDSADLRVRIPMNGSVDSINVATAGAIAFERLARR